VDAGAWHGCSSPASERSLAQGTHTVSVRARDRAGNVSAAVTAPAFTVDTVAPNTALESWPVVPVPGAASFEFSSPEAGVGFQCRIDSLTAWAACSSPVSFSAIPAGWWRMAVRAVDAAGNPDGSPARVWFESTG
jgi:hypothetical protein